MLGSRSEIAGVKAETLITHFTIYIFTVILSLLLRKVRKLHSYIVTFAKIFLFKLAKNVGWLLIAKLRE